MSADSLQFAAEWAAAMIHSSGQPLKKRYESQYLGSMTAVLFALSQVVLCPAVSTDA
jgi:hypothetical protein